MRLTGRGRVVVGALAVGAVIGVGAVLPDRVTIPETAEQVGECFAAGRSDAECTVNREAYTKWIEDHEEWERGVPRAMRASVFPW